MSDEDSEDAGRPVPAAGWRRFIETPLIACGALAVFAMMFLSVGDALLRSLFNAPIFGANDYTQIILSIAVSISLPLCVLAGRVIAIDTLVALLSDRLRRPVDVLVSVAGAVMMAYLAWRALLNAREAARFAETTLLLQLPLDISYYALAAGSALAALLLLTESGRHES
ncbi:TRAP transporter small permease [Hoeflea sp.]|uniref:TRAP transporter small permease n=1 Tax=Hoeflea sp. TaxID=1940281 RepID=UPI003B02E9E7